LHDLTTLVHRLVYSDHIIVLNDGTIAEQGSFETLRTAGGYVESIDAKFRDVEKKVTSTGGKKPRESTPHRDQNPDAATEDLARLSGDWSIYKYYAKESGLVIMFTFLGCCFTFAISLKAPGEPNN
jgi:ATP-binding cassette subfamily C (CFTR/MRP) protein 1